MRRNFPLQSKMLFVFLLAPFWISCGSETPEIVSSTQCASKTAEIIVGDSSQTIVCGCDESAGTITRSGDPAICTVPLGHTIVFHLLGAKGCQRLVAADDAVSAEQFFVSPACLKKQGRLRQGALFHVFTPGARATLRYVNSSDPMQTGQIVVR